MPKTRRYTKVIQVSVTDDFHQSFTERADKEGKRVTELARNILEEEENMKSVQEQLIQAIRDQLLKDPDIKVQDGVITDLILGKKEGK